MTVLVTFVIALAPQVADPEREAYLAHVAAAQASLRLAWAPDATRLVMTSMDGSFAVIDRRPARAR